MKKKGIIITLIILIAILFLLSFLIVRDLKNSENIKQNEKDRDISVSSFKLSRNTNSYILSFDIQNKKGIEMSSKEWTIYLLDNENNLLYIVNNVSFDSTTSQEISVTYEIEYDISNIKKIIISSDEKDVSYNKDLTRSIKYIGKGITTTTTQKTTIIRKKTPIEIE